MNSPFLYSLKVWLSSVLVAPIIYGFYYAWPDWGHPNVPFSDVNSLMQAYFGALVIGATLSLITWLMFLVATIITCREIKYLIQRKLILSGVGAILTILTFILFSSLSGSLSDVPLIIMFSYCLCIVGGSISYRPGRE